MPYKRAQRLNETQTAAIAIAVTAASDEEFAEGIPVSDRNAILLGKRGKKAPPSIAETVANAIKPKKTATPAVSEIDRDKMKAHFQAIAERKKAKGKEKTLRSRS